MLPPSTECRMLRGSPPCCERCHEDFRNGEATPIERDVDGLVAQVCHTVANWLDSIDYHPKYHA